ncbi:MAG TPA: carbamoyltransferase C-terminal domain-containing protein [Elusimicrobiota bacterium]|nr:carbamoyltransferase C-terminal domain-containing protein [Elusimicrobiota bacterium]
MTPGLEGPPILGIVDNHDSGVALWDRGRIVFAVNEERLNREKITRSFPRRSLEALMEYTRLSPSSVGEIVVGSRITPPFVFRFMNRWYNRTRKQGSVFSYSVNIFYLWQVALSWLGVWEKADVWFSRCLFRWKLRKWGFQCPIRFVDHHQAHACSAYYTAGFKEALIVTMDGMGDSRGVTVSLGRGREIEAPLYWESGCSAITMFYSRVTEYLGFRPLLHEGKIMALAAYGDKSKAYHEMKGMLSCREGRFNRIDFILPQSRRRGPFLKLRGYSREDIAAAAQAILEEEVSAFVRYWMNKTGSKNLVLAGGVFANIKLNQRLSELREIDAVYIFPHMGDGGLAVGAVLSCVRPPPQKLTDVFWGLEYDEGEILGALQQRDDIVYARVGEIEKTTGYLLAQKKLVAHFHGRMEFGPRALGNRSIFYEATDPSIKDRLNKKLNRTEFMPFAPILPDEHRQKYFINTEKARYTAEFLNISFACRPETARDYPGIVHVDGTARPQLVRKENNPRIHGILEWYHRFSGLDILINTSFNMHEEPIICRPQEALEAFVKAELDFLILDHYVVALKGHRLPRPEDLP